MTIVGEYSREGYRVVNAATGNTFFAEGNIPGGGQRVIDPYHRCALPIHTIRTKCTAKTKQIAAECGAVFGGVERLED